MVNFGWNSASLLGIFLCVAGAGLYFLRTIRPELSRDYDIFFSAVGLVCGFILLFNGWRLDPILQFSQFLLAASTLFFAYETLRLRGVATEQAKRSTPVVDDDRTVSRSYQAYREPEYDELEPYGEKQYNRRQLRGTEYEAEPRRTRRTRTSEAPSEPPTERRSRRPSRPSSRAASSSAGYSSADRYSDRYDEWEEEWDLPDEPYEKPSPSRSRPSRRDEDVPPSRPVRSRRPRPSSPPPEPPSSRYDTYEDEEPAPYVDYIDYQDEPDDSFERNEEDFTAKDYPREDYDEEENWKRPSEY